tara:strand:+ start:21072 stop:21227 length:156 start_codon:yes stop_codon:yes gene_type:complete
MKWWQKKVKGWTVPFWYTDTPLFSKRFSDLNKEEVNKLTNKIRKSRRNGNK